MLTHILVNDLAIVSGLELDLAAGMTALTGETGAGKSILIDALGLVLGDKADADLVRAGCERAEIIAGFDLRACPAARDWLAEQDLDEGEECLVRRLVARQGRSRAYINGRPATGAQLQGLGERLIDIHGQHAHQSLLRVAHQRDLLDAYGGTSELATQVAEHYRAYRDLDRRLERLHAESADRAARLDLLRYQVEELAALGLDADEIRGLDQEQKRLANLGTLQGTAGRLLQRFYDGEPSLYAELSQADADLAALGDLDPRLAATRELVEGAAIQVEEAAADLRRYLDELELDPGLMEQVEQRLTQVQDLARKYRVAPDRIPETLQALRTELDALERDDTTLEALAGERDQAHATFLAAAERLSAARALAARRLSETVTQAMQELGMTGGRFLVEITKVQPEAANAQGLDRPAFLVSANPGQPLHPLAKVASGGELSRISLGLQVATAECGSVPTLVFDEVDVGIGGGVAEIVGRLLRTLGGTRQVLCVTHLPQVAAQAHNHLLVRKLTRDGQTYTAIENLGASERVGEVARMLGGREITRKTLDHAREMIDRSQH
ncbi:MAG: DNA repair protein RecN [Candidatus Thiosymbion ectosymbiont of Robbea hypermnestra]|nr:DNA repair protein RecN [Candidatus Thiosymbion ectosymbiont of Robbea hypermnestra]